MTYAVAKIKLGPTTVEASLGDGGWTCAVPEVEASLNLVAHPSLFGVAEGEPLMRAATKVRDDLGADVEVLVYIESEPDVIY